MDSAISRGARIGCQDIQHRGSSALRVSQSVRPGRSEMTQVESEELVEEMFVQVARGSTSNSGELTLTGISPTTLYFSDRPKRVVGHMTTDKFVGLWDDRGENSFGVDPPNAVLSFV